MKKFWKFVTLVILLTSLTDWGLGTLFDHWYPKIKTGQTGGKINYYLNKTLVPSLVIVGNSRALYQVIPDSLHAQSFNLSHAGMSQVFQTGLLSILKDAHKMPSVILLHLEPEEFTFDDNGNDIQNLKYYYGKNKLVTQYISEISIFESSKYVFHLYRYNGRVFTFLKNLVQSTYLFKEYNGYEVIPATIKDSINTIYSANNVGDIKNENLNERQISYLLEFIRLCSESKTKVICFTSPLYRQPKRINLITSKLNSILKSKGVHYIDFIQNPIEGLQRNPSLWKDAYHLNHNGARIESSILGLQIKELL